MIDSGLVVIAAFVSPYEADRQMVREIVGAPNFVEVFVDCTIEVCELRDVKGLYKRALAGEIENFTGVSDPYEAPASPELTIHSSQ